MAIDCPQLESNDSLSSYSCLVIYQLSGVSVPPTPRECNSCSRCVPSQSINDVTKAIASELLVQDGKPPLYSGNGPGTRLKNLISWFIETPPGCDCENRSQIMDAWGVEGCRINIKTIITWLVEAAMMRDITITRMSIHALIESVLIVSSILDSQHPAKVRSLD